MGQGAGDYILVVFWITGCFWKNSLSLRDGRSCQAEVCAGSTALPVFMWNTVILSGTTSISTGLKLDHIPLT